MILTNLCDEEIIRVAQPGTDLEHLLMERLSAATDEIEELREEIRPCGIDHECSGCDSKDDDISELEERIEYLESQLDEHKIEYNK